VGEPLTKTKALCVGTRCATVQQFIDVFSHYCDEQSFFVATLNMRPVGLETAFSIQLADRTPVLRGLCVVLAAWTSPANPFKRPGIRLGIRRLTADSEVVFAQLRRVRDATPPADASPPLEAMVITVPAIVPRTVTPHVVPSRTTQSIATRTPITPPPVPTPKPAEVSVQPTPAEAPERTPGSKLVLPANPLQDLTDDSLQGFVDCTLYEETANFFPVADDHGEADPVAPPPVAEPVPAFRPSGAFAAERVEPQYIEVDERMPEATITELVEPPIQILRPVDEAHRMTPVPAGEIVRGRRVSRTPRRIGWLVGGAGLAVGAIVVIVLTTRSRADDERVAPSARPTASGKAQPPVHVAATPPTHVPGPTHTDPPPPTEPPRPARPPAPAHLTPVPPAPAPTPATPTHATLAAPTPEGPTVPSAGDGPCKVEVSTNPAGAMVQLDGRTVGPSPIVLAGPCTRSRIDLVHPRYKAEQRWVTLEEGKPASLDVTLVRPTHALQVITKPAGAQVSIAGRPAGTSPTLVKLMGFTTIEVKLTRLGYEPVTRRIYTKTPLTQLVVPLKPTLFLNGSSLKRR